MGAIPGGRSRRAGVRRRTGWVVVALLAVAAPGAAQERSVALTGGATVVGQWASDDRARAETVGSLDLFLDVPLGRGWLHVYVEGNTTPFAGGISALVGEANTDAGTALDARHRGRVQVSEVRMVWPLGEDVRGHMGLVDVTGFLDVSRIANDENLFFLGVPFVNNPTIEFPDYALGGVVEGSIAGSGTHFAVTVTSSHGLADNPGVSYAQLLDLGEEGKGIFAGAKLRWVGPAVRLSLGGWVNSARHIRFRDTGTEFSRGLFSVVGWGRREHTWSARVGLANDDISVIRGFVGLSYLWTRRPNALGVAVGRSLASTELPEASGVTHGEIFVRRRLWREVFVTTSVQRLHNPGFDPRGESVGPRLWVGGIRLSASF